MGSLSVKLDVSEEISIKCFGGFEVYYHGKPVRFRRQKGKELLAFLVEKKGTGVTNEQIAEALFEGKEYNRGTKGAIQKTISSLRSDLKDAGIEHIICHNWNSLSINPERVQCDFFDYINGDESCIHKFAGDYMSCYSWAESTNGYLDMQLFK